MMTTKFYTYLHCRPDNSPFYVGKGSGRRGLRVVGCGRNAHHSNIVAKHGANNIKVYIFPCESKEQALADEVQQIAQLRKAGYILANKSSGGELGSCGPLSEAHKHKISESQRGRTQKPVSDETRIKMSLSAFARGPHAGAPEKISATLRGRKHSPERVLKVSRALAGRRPSDACIAASVALRKGVPQSPELLAKRIAAMTGKKRTPAFCEKMSEITKARYAMGEITTLVDNRGKAMPAETRQKISNSLLARNKK